MKMPKHRRKHKNKIGRTTQRPQEPNDGMPRHESHSLPVLLAGVFTKLRLAQRALVLRRLLIPIGPMALAVLGGGAFVKFMEQARWSRLSVSLDDAARVTSSQVFDLVRYVEQSDPGVLQEVMVALSRDPMAMAAVGGSVAAVVMGHLLTRSASRVPFAQSAVRESSALPAAR
jgi:hypothetical protein